MCDTKNCYASYSYEYKFNEFSLYDGYFEQLNFKYQENVYAGFYSTYFIHIIIIVVRKKLSYAF